MYAAIAGPDKKEQIVGLIGDSLVFSEFDSFDRAGLKRVFEKVLRIPLNTLVFDVSFPVRLEDFLNTIAMYRRQRPSTRIVILAIGRTPGDYLVAALVKEGIFDIVSEENWLHKLKEVLEQPVADYSTASIWDIQISENSGEETFMADGYEKSNLNGLLINSGSAIKIFLRRGNISSLRKLPKIRRGNPSLEPLNSEIPAAQEKKPKLEWRSENDETEDIESDNRRMQNLADRLNARVVTVWNPDGYKKANTALELALSIKTKAGRCALLEFDTVNPELDEIFKVPFPPMQKCAGKEPWEIGAGLVTFGDRTTPELAASFIYSYRWGVNYLPSGNRLDALNLSMGAGELCELIEIVIKNYEHVVINACSDLGNEATRAAVKKSEIVVVPVSKASNIIKRQVDWLKRSGIKVFEYNPTDAKKQRKGILWLK